VSGVVPGGVDGARRGSAGCRTGHAWWTTGVRLARPRAVLVGVVTLVYALLFAAVLTGSPLVVFDTAVLRWSPSAQWPALGPFLSVWVLLGQRAVCLALAGSWLILRALRARDARPLLALGLATLLLNGSVGLVKTATGRLGPLQLGSEAVHAGASTIFADGTIFPSGHTANAVVTWGLLAWVARRHRRLWGVVAGLLAVSVGLTTIYLGTHWVSDVLAGWAAGGLVLLAVLALTPLVDRLERMRVALSSRLRRVRPGAGLPAPAGIRVRLPLRAVGRRLGHGEWGAVPPAASAVGAGTKRRFGQDHL
jgi:membrane-associated phospholipid phosphatase